MSQEEEAAIAGLAELLDAALTLAGTRANADAIGASIESRDAQVASIISNNEDRDLDTETSCTGIDAGGSSRDAGPAATVPSIYSYSSSSSGESDDEDSYAASASSSDSEADYARAAWQGPPPPLKVYEPLLPVGAKTLLGNCESTLGAIANMVAQGKARRIVVMAGAGISTDAGIPDFRSPNTGLYDNLQQFNLPHPEAIFSIDYFRRNPKPFYVLAKELYPGQYVPTQSHFFVKLLAQKGLLLRHYTQNIDCLERAAGIDPELIVEAHGSFHTAHCIGRKCRKEYSQDWVREQIFLDAIPRCDKCGSLVKPDITFFGEGLPARFFELLAQDFDECDLLIVMGTSLLVQPFASLIDKVGPLVPRLLINRERVGEAKVPGLGFDFDGCNAQTIHRDAFVAGDSDEACALLAGRLGWLEELAGLRKMHVAMQGEK